MKLRFAACLILTASALLAAKADADKRLNDAALVFEEVMSISDKAIPQDLLDKAHCIVIVPGLKKGAFIIGAKYGKGFINCRKTNGQGWTAPATARIEGGSVGFQIGGSESDVIMLVMNERGAERLLSSKFTMGGAGEVAAGPVGRSGTAQTDATLRAEILSWSRSRGAFAGLSLQGATLRQDLSDNRELYGRTIENREIIKGEVAPPDSAGRLLGLLNKYSPQHLK